MTLCIHRLTPEYASCKVITVPEKYDYKRRAFGFQKNSPYVELFSYHLKKMKESGILQKIVDSYQVKEQICPDYNGQALDIKSCITAFIIMGIGFGASTIIWILEKLINLFKDQPIDGQSSHENIKTKIHQLEMKREMLANVIDDLKQQVFINTTNQ